MNTLFIRDILIYGILVVFVLYVTKINNIWGAKRGTTKTKIEARKSKSDAKKRKRLLWWIKFFENVCDTFGFAPSKDKLLDYKFKIIRTRHKFVLLERGISPKELVGVFKVIKFLGCFLGTFLFLITKNPITLFLFVTLGIDFIYVSVMDSKIMSEDAEIEEDFPDLFLLLYSRLLKGSKVRLTPTLDEYLKSIDLVHGQESHKAIRHFVKDLRNNIELYGDDSMAVHKMREMYKSSMLVNFFNLAIQSLRGVDNSDKLLAFKIELNQKKLQAMRDLAQKRVEKGQRVIWAIFIILAQFVILSWVAKAGLGSLVEFLGI